MGQFKPMVKMFTDEPSVILKLKKGGKVKAAGQSEGFKSMSQTSGGDPFAEAEKGKSPKKPSMHERHKAMNPNQYAKGGKVAHKQMGGVMMPGAAGAGALGGAAPVGTGAAMQPMARAALAGMAPAARAARAARVRRALTGMKKGGAACAALEKELKHHESLSASKAHGKASGGEIDSADTKTTLKNSVKPFAKTKMDTSKKDKAHGTGEVKEGRPAGYKMGGTIEGNEGEFENTKMVDGDKADKAHGTSGVKMGNAGGFKHGGKAHKMHHKASGGTIDSKLTRTTVEGGNWENRAANTSKPGVKNTSTGEVKESNAGGYRKGGSAKKHFATGGNVVDDGKAEKMPARIKHSAVANTMQSGTFKRGGNVKKADGGDVEDKYAPWSKEKSEAYKKSSPMASRSDLEARSLKSASEKKMSSYLKELDRQESSFNPRYSEAAVNKAIASSNRSGRKISGKEAKAIHSLLRGRYDSGGSVPSDIADELKTAEAQRAFKNWERSQTEENEADRSIIPSALRRMADSVGSLFTSSKKPEGSITKTEKSVTVAPAKKRGGSTRH
jgi:hypothetical protein